MKNLTRLDIFEIILGVIAVFAIPEYEELGSAIIGASCIAMITWIEITRFKTKK